MKHIVWRDSLKILHSVTLKVYQSQPSTLSCTCSTRWGSQVLCCCCAAPPTPCPAAPDAPPSPSRPRSRVAATVVTCNRGLRALLARARRWRITMRTRSFCTRWDWWFAAVADWSKPASLLANSRSSFQSTTLSCYQHNIMHSAKHCTLGLEGSHVLRLLEHQRLPVWGVKCPLKQTLSTIKCHTGTRVKCQSQSSGYFDQSASSRRLFSLSVLSASTDWWREVTGGSVRSDLPGDGDLLICTVSSSSPRGPQMKLFFLSPRLFTSHRHSLHTTPPHTCARHFTHWAPARGVHAPQNVPIALSAKKKTKKFFRHQPNACLPHSAFIQSQSLFLIVTLTSTNAENSWTEA